MLKFFGLFACIIFGIIGMTSFQGKSTHTNTFVAYSCSVLKFYNLLFYLQMEQDEEFVSHPPFIHTHTYTRIHTCILHMEQDAGFVGAQLNDEPLGSNIGWRENCVGNHVSWTQDIEGLLVCT